jgi:hypothetical protein
MHAWSRKREDGDEGGREVSPGGDLGVLGGSGAKFDAACRRRRRRYCCCSCHWITHAHKQKHYVKLSSWLATRIAGRPRRSRSSTFVPRTKAKCGVVRKKDAASCVCEHRERRVWSVYELKQQSWGMYVDARKCALVSLQPHESNGRSWGARGGRRKKVLLVMNRRIGGLCAL